MPLEINRNNFFTAFYLQRILIIFEIGTNANTIDTGQSLTNCSYHLKK